MNRIDRLFAILLQLQFKEFVRAEDLAETFSLSKRTIYRDIKALIQIGVPIVSLPGEGYTLVEGYYLPPLIFSPTEAGALVLGTRLLQRQAEGAFIEESKKALEKIITALPQKTRAHVAQLTTFIEFITPEARFNLDDPQLRLLQEAISNQRVVYLSYHSYHANVSTQRQFDPYRLYYSEGVWYVSGFCHLRQAQRTFRLARIEALELLPDTFVPFEEPNDEVEKTAVSIWFAKDTVRWVRERQHYAFTDHEQTVDDGIIMSYRVNSFLELKPWVLSWGASANVLSPRKFQDEIRQEVASLFQMLT